MYPPLPTFPGLKYPHDDDAANAKPFHSHPMLLLASYFPRCSGRPPPPPSTVVIAHPTRDDDAAGVQPLPDHVDIGHPADALHVAASGFVDVGKAAEQGGAREMHMIKAVRGEWGGRGAWTKLRGRVRVMALA